MNSGVVTAPVLFAGERFGEVWDIVERKVEREGDFERILEFVERFFNVFMFLRNISWRL